MEPRKCAASDCDVMYTPKKSSIFCSLKCRLRQKSRDYRAAQGIVPTKELRRNCKHCDVEFTPKNSRSECCSVEHAKIYANTLRRERGSKLTERDKMLQQMMCSIGCTPLAFLTVEPDFDTLWELDWTDERFQQFKTDNRWESTMALVRKAQDHIVEEGPMDVRHLHYLLVSDHIVIGEKEQVDAEGEHMVDEDGEPLPPLTLYYENTVEHYGSLTSKIAEARLRGDIGLNDIRDDLREAITYNAWDSPEDFWTHVTPAFKLDMWREQKEIVEIWTEKNSVVGVIKDTCEEYRVPIRPLRGQSSLSFVWESAKALSDVEKPLYIYYLGDHDASGYGIEKSMCERLVALLLDRCNWKPRDVIERLHWKRIGFLHEDFDNHDIEALDANDKADNVLHDWFVEMFPDCKAAELEALPPRELRERVVTAIDKHRNKKVWKKWLAKEEDGRKALRK
jgi:hypothetical protein